MPITIEQPTAAAIYEAIQGVPASELEQLRRLLNQRSQGVDQKDYWTDEDKEDFRRSTYRLIEQRLGEEKYDYD